MEEFWLTYNTLIFTIGVNALLALSIWLTLACGLLSLGNAAFMAMGAYTAALCGMNLGTPFGVSLLAGMTLPAAVAWAIGGPVLRLSGVYLAMATLGFGEVVRVVLLNLEITGGPLGLNGIPMRTEGWHIGLAVVACVYLLIRLKRSKVGRAFEAIREDEVAAEVMGVHVARYKLFAFVLGAAIAGLAGGFAAHYTFFLSPNEFGFERAVDILAMAVLGGVEWVVGPVAGAAILTVLPEVLRPLQDYRMAVNGLVLVLVVLVLPSGLSTLAWKRRP